MEALIFAPLSWLYQLGTWLDRILTRKHRLARPVISVGNIALGGRAKTPVVIYLCRKLRSAGFAPVVLTRGYGRGTKEPILWSGGASDVRQMGDEAVEIARSGAADAVLVGANRAKNAQDFLFQQTSPRPWVFVLDDGFQHWAIERDVDIVVVDKNDMNNHVLPWGELRESPLALRRAHHILEIGRDLLKDTQVVGSAQELPRPMVLTTRANPNEYLRDMKRRFPGAELCALRDHASSEVLVKAIRVFEGREVILGDKEAVKLLTEDEYHQWLVGGVLSKRYAGIEKRFHRASLQIIWQNEHQALQAIFTDVRRREEVRLA